MIIDTHSHLNFSAYKKDFDEVIKRTLKENIWMINVGTKYETSKGAVELAEKYEEGVFAAIGLHPMYAAAEFVKTKTDPDEGEFFIKEEGFNYEKYKELAKSRKVVAIGEIGLDYYYKPKSKEKLEKFKEKQKEVFLQQLKLADELNLPLIFHCRVAHKDMIEILKSYILIHKSINGVVHCFTGSVEEMEEYVKLGFYIGLNGIIFKLNLNEVIKKTPLENILVETDCPYLTPPQEGDNPSSRAELTTGRRRNEPIFIKHTIERIAQLKNLSFQEICDKTTENARGLFKI